MLVGLVSALALAVPTAAGASPASEPPTTCGNGSWVAGTVDLCAGELVYRDYVYDDFGARPKPPLPIPTVPAIDFQSLPKNDAYGGLPPAGEQRDEDQTDLIALRVTADGTIVHVQAELNTMTAPDHATLAIAIDRDHNAATDSGAWPGFVANTLGSVPLHATGWDELHAFTTGDPDSNMIDGSFPQPPGAEWRLWAVIAKPDGTVMNVAFRGVDEHGFWWEDAQADALQQGDITAMAADVTVADLTSAVTRQQVVPPGAVRQRVYISATPLGEGISDKGVPGPGFDPRSPIASVSQAFTMLGKYQPYGFYEPAGAAPHGLELALHGLEENHAARLTLPGTHGNFVKRLGDDRDRVIATPLGRGWKGWYSSYSERDVLDVLADVEANYPIDTDRVIMSGYSMGGYGAMQLAALHPDLFAGVINWVGWTGDFFNGTLLAGAFFNTGSNGGANLNAIDLLGSLRHVPIVSLYSGADELVPVASALGARQRLADLGVPSIFYLHPAAEHLTYAVLDDWTKESNDSANDVLVHDPAHITYRTDRTVFYPDLGLVPDHAYWVSDIVPAADGYADVDARSLGCGADEPVMGTTSGTGTDPVPWVSQTVAPVGTTHLAPANTLELTVHNVASLHIDLARACLTPDAAVQITADQPVTVSLSDGRTVSFTPEELPRTGGTAADWAPMLLALALVVRLVGRRRAAAAR
jgi:hypothetical protein